MVDHVQVVRELITKEKLLLKILVVLISRLATA